jgi:phage terminase small subunit
VAKPVRPKPPDRVGKPGRELWAAVVDDVPDDCDLDARELALLGQACRAADHLAALEAVVARDGVTALGSKRQPVVHPAVAEARQQRLAILRLLGALGLEERPAVSAASSPSSLRARRAADARWGTVRALREGRVS